MKTETETNTNILNFSTLHFHLGLTRTELKKRLSMGLIDPQILNNQINESSKELKLNALCESWIEANSMEQVDKHSVFDRM